MKIKFIYKKIILVILFFTFSTNLNADTSIYKLTADKIIYENDNKKIIANGNAQGEDQFGRKISADKIIYDKNKSTITSERNSQYLDKNGNKITAVFFIYDLNKKIISAKNNVEYSDRYKNKFYFSEFSFYENSEIGYGKNLIGELADKSSIEGRIAEIDNISGIIKIKNESYNNNIFKKFLSIFDKNNNKYTTCENYNIDIKSIDERCPDWSISTVSTIHDQNKKMVYHKEAVIKIKNIPIFYTPYFSHPDPTVKRKSGFLVPSIKNFENLGRTLKTPYFWELNDDTDATLTPIFYQDENAIYLTELRKQNLNSLLLIDTSYTRGYKDLNKKAKDGASLNRTGGSRNHFFLNFLGNYDNLIFPKNDIEINIQRISQKNYLNVNQINTEVVKQDIVTLNNSFIINSYSENKRIKISSSIYEDLNNDNPNTKYQYKIPYLEYNNYFNKFNQNINFFQNFEFNNYNADTKQSSQVNILETTSDKKILHNIGVSNTFKTKFLNNNSYNEQVDNMKENLNSDLYATVALETELPLAKFENKRVEEYITPKTFIKYTNGSMTNANSINKILEYSDVFIMDRMNNYNNPETGASLGYGVNYEIIKKNEFNIVYLKSDISIGQILKKNELKEMPTNSSLNRKSSDLVGKFEFFFDKALYKNEEKIKENFQKTKDIMDIKNEGFNFTYSYSLSNDLNKLLKNDIITTYKSGQNEFSVNYYELNEIGDTHYIEGKYKHNFQNNFNLLFSARKNLELNYSESNTVEFNYESDCLKFGINLSKKFYNNDDVKSDNNLTLFIMLKPFGQPIAPDLSNFLSEK